MVGEHVGDVQGIRADPARIGDGPTKELLRSTDRDLTTATDTDVQTGTRITYVIEALDRDGQVVGRGEATVSCC